MKIVRRIITIIIIFGLTLSLHLTNVKADDELIDADFRLASGKEANEIYIPSNSLESVTKKLELQQSNF